MVLKEHFHDPNYGTVSFPLSPPSLTPFLPTYSQAPLSASLLFPSSRLLGPHTYSPSLTGSATCMTTESGCSLLSTTLPRVRYPPFPSSPPLSPLPLLTRCISTSMSLLVARSAPRSTKNHSRKRPRSSPSPPIFLLLPLLSIFLSPHLLSIPPFLLFSPVFLTSRSLWLLESTALPSSSWLC